MKAKVDRRTVDLTQYPDLMEAIYDDVPRPIGLSRFAPVVPAHGPMFGAWRRLHVPGEADLPPAVPESALGVTG